MKENHRCLLIVPPMRSITTPPLGVPLLKANLNKHGFPTDALYTNCRLAERHGYFLQFFLHNAHVYLTDFIFSCVLFDRTRADIEHYEKLMEANDYIIHMVLKNFFPSVSVVDVLCGLVDVARRFAKQITTEIVERQPWLLGLSSNMSDNTFSFHVIREVKRLRPETITVMGGVNCGGEMGEEMFSRFPEIDHICQGDADHSLIELVSQLAEHGRVLVPIRGVLSRGHEDVPVLPAIPLKRHELESLPDPDFSDAIEQIATKQRDLLQGKLKSLGFLTLPMESTRGCWWAAKHGRCSFCGMNPDSAEYRSKSFGAVHKQLVRLVERYKPIGVLLTDTLPDKSLFRTFLPEVAKKPVVKIYSTTTGSLSRSKVALLAAANATYINTGIESLSDNSLKLMGKPTSARHNIELLKWCAEFGVRVMWFWIYGVPGERIEEIDDLKSVIRKIPHLQPPVSPTTVSVSRDSRYFESPDKFKIDPLIVHELTREIYPFPEESVMRLSYYVDAEFFRQWKRSDSFKEMAKAINRWQKVHWRSHLVYIRRRRGALIIDTRPSRLRFWNRLSLNEAQVYELCTKARSLQNIITGIAGDKNEEKVQGILDAFVEKRLMLRLADSYLSLALTSIKRYRPYETENNLSLMIAGIPLQEIWRFGRELGIAPSRLWRTLLRMMKLKLIIPFKGSCKRIVSMAIFRIVSLFSQRDNDS